MTTGTHPFRFAALASFALILPFVLIESFNGGLSQAGMSSVVLLFGLLWLLPTLSIGGSLWFLYPPAGTRRTSPKTVLLCAAIVLVAALLWGSLIADQLPCFLGVPDCS